MVNISENEQVEAGENEGNFMLPIWLITLATMVGTGLLSYAVHTYKINRLHAQNLEQIANIDFRTEKYTEYRNILKNDGIFAAKEYLNKQ